MKKRTILPLLNLLLWGVFLLFAWLPYLGGFAVPPISLLFSDPKLQFYVTTPSVHFLIAMCTMYLANKVPLPFLIVVSVTQFLMLFPFLAAFGGGM